MDSGCGEYDVPVVTELRRAQRCVPQPVVGQAAGNVARVTDDTAPATPEIEFRSDVTVELVRSSASDSDVLFAARVSTQGRADSRDGGRRRRGRAEPGPWTHQLPDARPARLPVRAQLDDLLRAGADLRVPRVHAAPHRLVQRGVGPLPRAAPGLLRPRPGAQPGAGGKPGAYEFVRAPPEQYALVDVETRDACDVRIRRVSADARGRRRPRGRPHRAAAEHLLVDVRDDECAIAHELPVAAHQASTGTHFPSFPQREIEMCAEKMEAIWTGLMPFTHAAFNANGRVSP